MTVRRDREPLARTVHGGARRGRRSTVNRSSSTVRRFVSEVKSCSCCRARRARGPRRPATREIVMGRRRAPRRIRAPARSDRARVVVSRFAPHDLARRVANASLDVRALPDADAVARGWDLQLERGMQAALPPPIGGLVDAARARFAPRPARARRRRRARRLGLRCRSSRRLGSSRLGRAAPGPQADRRRTSRGPRRSRSTPAPSPRGSSRTCAAVLVRERSGAVDLLPDFPPEWLGQAITVDAVPLHAGAISFAVRWHGPRPALLWESPAGIESARPRSTQ